MSDRLCNARFVGRSPVHGSLSDPRLSSIVSELLLTSRDPDNKCNLEITEKYLLINYIKKDEGFCESDGESIKSQDEKTGSDVKVIQDHVFNEKTTKVEDFEGEDSDTSSANSSGTDSVDEHHRNPSSSSSEEEVAGKGGIKFDHKESYPLNEVLICHADREYRKCVVWVVRKSSHLEALVFQCPSEESVRDLYRRYQDAYRRSKLDRQRGVRKSGNSNLNKSVESILGEGSLSSSKPHQHRHSANADTFQKWNLIQHTDSDGVTHIEVESSDEARRSEKPDKSKFARELESILSKELKFRPSKSESKSSRRNENNLSLRQRAPAMLLRKFDEMEEKAQRVWAKAEEEQNRKVWAKSSSKPPRGNTQSSSTSKRQSSSLLTDGGGNPNNKQILIPTKTGSEPVKKLYPKDQAPPTGAEMMLRNHHTRYLTLAPNPISFSTPQPHSLPIYHVPAVGHITWAARYPAIVDYSDALWNGNVGARSSASLIGTTPRGRSRDRISRDSTSDTYKRRAQSKSPARSERNLSRRFREFGDAVKNRMSRRSQNPISASIPDVPYLKSNLKKPNTTDSNSSPHSMDSSFSSSSHPLEESNGNDKKVHFNKFATVQMME